MDETGYESEFHYGLVHEPMSIKVAMKIAETRRGCRSRMKQAWFFYHLKHAELAKHLQKYSGRGVLQEDNVKDDNGYRAVFAERGASASQLAAAKVSGYTAGMAGEAHEAVSAHTPVRMSEAHGLLRSPEKA